MEKPDGVEEDNTEEEEEVNKGGRPPGSPNKVYDLRDALLSLLKIQEKRIKKMYDEEGAKWLKNKTKKGSRNLDPGLSKEIVTAMNLAETLYKVGGQASEGKVKGKGQKDEEIEEEIEKLDEMLKKKMVNLARKVNGG